MHLFVLLFHLISWLTRASSGSAASGPKLGARRKDKGPQVAMECPHCGTLGVAEQELLMHYSSRGWIQSSAACICPNCRRKVETRFLHNDGTGVLVGQSSACPSCGNSNYAFHPRCTRCGRPLAA